MLQSIGHNETQVHPPQALKFRSSFAPMKNENQDHEHLKTQLDSCLPSNRSAPLLHSGKEKEKKKQLTM